MALNVTQVNQAFLGLLGRPATGAEAAKFAGQLDAATLAQTLLTDASFKTQLSLEAPSFKTVDLQNTDLAAFVESLYTALLGRASDAEGKAFWLSVAGATPNRADVVSQFIAAVKSQEGTADANAFATIQAEDKALANAWVESLYNNLAGRASDAEGLDFWTNAIVSFAMTPAQVAASFAAALALQGNTTEDGQNYLAKLGVADNFTASFKDFSTLITANEKTEALKNLVTMMNGVNKDSQVEQYTDEISKNVNEFQNFQAIQFTAKDDDDLGIDPETGESNTTSGVNFTGTYNLIDPEKGTIQSSDRATGSEKYLTDTLTINVTGYDKDTHSEFKLEDLPGTTSIEKLIINNGAASVNGDISGDFEYINVNGTGSFTINNASTNAKDGFKDISLNSAADKDGLNEFSTSNDVRSIKTGAGNDKLSLTKVTKSLNTGAGDDDVTATLSKGATADLGAGDDKFTGSLGKEASLLGGAGDDTINLKSVTSEYKKGNPVSDIKIDGGTGNDTLDLATDATTTNFQGIESIRGVESLKVATGTALNASAISGQKIEVSGTSMILNAKTASNVDLSKLSNAEGENVAVSIVNVKSGNINLAAGTKDFRAMQETIVLAKDAGKVTIKGLEQGYDKVAIAGTSAVDNTYKKLFVKDAAGKDESFATDLAKDTVYFVNLKEKVTKANINDLLSKSAGGKFTSLNEKDVFYIIATDAEAAGGEGKNSAAKVYKVEVGKDQKVGKLDQISTITVADKEQISATSVEASANVVTYAGTSITLDELNGQYGSTGLSYDNNNKVYVNGVSGALTVNGEATDPTGLSAFITTASGKVTNNSAAKVDVYLGGSNAGPDTTSAPLNLATANNADLGKGATSIIANATQIKFKDASLFGGTDAEPVRVDLGEVNTSITFNAAINTSTIDLSKLFKNEDGKDSVAVSGGATTNKVVGTKASDTITLAANTTDDTISVDLGQGGNDTLVATAQVINSTGKGVIMTSNAGAGDTITFGAASTIDGAINVVAAQTWTTNLITSLNKIVNGVNPGQGSAAKAAIVGQITGATGADAKYNGTYVIYNKTQDATITDDEDIVVFLGDVDPAKISLDSTTGVTIA